jgi:UPF0755 protein
MIKKGAPKMWRSFLIPTIIISCLAVLLLIISTIYIFKEPYNPTEIEINIPKGAKTWNILSILHNKGILPYPLLTLTGSLLVNGSSKVLAGEYIFKAGASPAEIMQMLQQGDVVEHKLTFPEGLTVYEIITQINLDNRFKNKINGIPEEGSLFPSTYHIHKHQDRNQLLIKMQETMKKITSELLQKNHNPYIKSAKDLIIFASILEKEAANPEEMPRIAGVFVNRLRQGMRLQSDPTVIYGLTLGKFKLDRPITRKDLKIDSAYNTYTRDFLPIGAICCPGLAALEAAAHPAQTNELYFVLEKDGKRHCFSVTYKEHLEHTRRIRHLKRTINE